MNSHTIFHCIENAFGVTGIVFGCIALYRQYRRPHAPKKLADGVLLPAVFSMLLFGMTTAARKLALPAEVRTNFDMLTICVSSILFLAFVILWCATEWKARRKTRF